MPADHRADPVPVAPLCQEGHLYFATRQEGGFPDTPAPLPAAVLWDMDGTLIDSERLWRVPTQRCVAVEDSPNGALAAERAGAAVLVVPCEVAVPTGPRRTFRDDLVGLTAAELGAALRAASDADEERVA